MLERSNDGKHRQHKAMTASRPFPGGDGISQRCRRKHFASSKWTGSISICWHFAALSPEAFRIVKVDGKHQHMLAFHSVAPEAFHSVAPEAFHIVIVDGKHQHMLGRIFLR